jgi:hypothetical protein
VAFGSSWSRAKRPDVMDRLIHLALSGGEGEVLQGFDRMFERLGRTSAR